MTGTARGARATTSRAAAKKDTTPPQDPDAVWVDTNTLTAGEIEAIEEAAAVPITHFRQMDKAQGPISRAMGWIVRLRTDSTAVYEDKSCDRVGRPQCGDCHCARRLKVMYHEVSAPTPPSGGNGS